MPVASVHREAVPLLNSTFFHKSVPSVNCQAVEILPTLLEGAKGADRTPEEVEYVIDFPALTTDSCPAGFTLKSGE